MSGEEKQISKIRMLDELTINQIAAGEVIENPASVVKELIENSLDAGSTAIHVEIAGGGRQLIRITDDGCGMSPDDALLCFERHATSKIKNVADVHQLWTMGFRGEAIPSIASISKFTLITSASVQNEFENRGTFVFVEGGKLLKSERAARDKGTTIEVKNLFFNVPARRNFQKSPSHDSADIAKVIENLALANPEVKFTLTDQQMQKLVAPHSNKEHFEEQLKERIGHLLGKKYLSESAFLQIEEKGFKLTGWIGLPHHSRPNKTGQFLFINKRAVISTGISLAVRDGYSTSLPANRYPVFVLHLEIDPASVDVNVHPQKKEVRLLQQAALKEVIRRGVNGALDTYLVHETPVDEAPFNEMVEPFQSETDHLAPSFFDSWKSAGGIIDLAIAKEPLPKKNFENSPRPLPVERAQFDDVIPSRHHLKPSPASSLFSEKNASLNVAIIGTIPGYVLLGAGTLPWMAKEALVVFLDQRAAHARVVFESMLRSKEGNQIESQPLLIPYQFETTKNETEALLERLTDLEKLGIGIREFGKELFTLEYLPVELSELNPTIFIRDLLNLFSDELEGSSHLKTHIEGVLEKKIVEAAFRAALYKQSSLTSYEAESLVKQLLKCKQPHFSPLGQPTAFSLGQLEIEKMMKKGSA